MLGGMSWESTALYYRLLNTAMQKQLGGHRNAKSVLFTLNYDELDTMASAGDWNSIASVLIESARRLANAGADFMMITAVTGHAVADEVEATLTIPLLHAADAAGEVIKTAGAERIALVGTRFTMSMDFFRGRLSDRYGPMSLCRRRKNSSPSIKSSPANSRWARSRNARRKCCLMSQEAWRSAERKRCSSLAQNCLC
jgi:aspartate racemase